VVLIACLLFILEKELRADLSKAWQTKRVGERAPAVQLSPSEVRFLILFYHFYAFFIALAANSSDLINQ